MARVAFLFPGQGAQEIGMGRDLCATLPAARRLFDEASAVLGYDLLDACVNGPKERLDSTAVSQPAIFVASLAALEKLRATEPGAEAECVAAAGLSLGEYTALTFAGVLSFADGVRLVKVRGEAMQAASDAAAGAMLSVVGLNREKVAELCAQANAEVGREGAVRLANLLSPDITVASGEAAACAALERLAKTAGALKTDRLAVAGAFHTPMMQPAVEKLTAALAGVEMREPRLPVWANVTGKTYTNRDEVKGLLARQVVEPVQWEPIQRGLLASGAERFYEIGPRRTLAPVLKRIDRKAECRNVAA